MPKGVPKTKGEKLKDEFDVSYKQMKKEYRRGKTQRKSRKTDCGCETCKAADKKK